MFLPAQEKRCQKLPPLKLLIVTAVAQFCTLILKTRGGSTLRRFIECHWDHRTRTWVSWLQASSKDFPLPWSLIIYQFHICKFPKMYIQPQVSPGCCHSRSWTYAELQRTWVARCTRSCPGTDKVMLSSLSWLPDCMQVIFMVHFVACFSHFCAFPWWPCYWNWPPSLLLTSCLVSQVQEGCDVPAGENTCVNWALFRPELQCCYSACVCVRVCVCEHMHLCSVVSDSLRFHGL